MNNKSKQEPIYATVDIYSLAPGQFFKFNPAGQIFNVHKKDKQGVYYRRADGKPIKGKQTGYERWRGKPVIPWDKAPAPAPLKQGELFKQSDQETLTTQEAEHEFLQHILKGRQ